MSSKVLLITIVIGEKYLKEYNLLFRKSQEDYARKNNYDFKVCTDYLDKNNQTPACISFNKILVCSHPWSKKYDFIIFIDADILINIHAPAIHNYMDYGFRIGIIDEFSQPSKAQRLKIQEVNGWELTATEYYQAAEFDIQTEKVLNTGVLVLQPRLHASFLEYIYNTYIIKSKTHPRKFHYEQSCIGYELQSRQLYTILDNKFNAVWALTKSDNIENVSLERFFQENYFIHFAGKTDFDKVVGLQGKHR